MKKFSYILLFAIILSVALVSTFDFGDTLHYFKLNEGVGITFADSITSINGNLVGDPSWVTGINGTAIQFNGTNYLNTTIRTGIDGNENRTFNVWTNFTGKSDSGTIFDIGNNSGDTGFALQINTVGALRIALGVGQITTQTGLIVKGSWQMISLTFNGSNALFYVNGSLVDSINNSVNSTDEFMLIGKRLGVPTQNFNGTIDEVGVWDTVKTASEINELWNDGNGLFITPLEIVILESPINDSLTTLTQIPFIANQSIGITLNLTNVTYFIWNSTGGIFNQTNISIEGITNRTTLIVSDFLFDTYQWNVRACYENTTFSDCSFAKSNQTFEVGKIQFFGSSFSNSTIEGNLETFTINISLASSFQVSSANLVYNSSANLGLITDLGNNNFTLTRELQIPRVGSQTNFSFFWNVVLNDGTESNSTSNNQSVSNLDIDDCSVFNFLILNYTLRDEGNQSFLPGAPFNTSMEIDLDIFPIGSTIPLIDFSQAYSLTNPAQVCLEDSLLNGTEYRMDVQMKYSARDRVTEYHHIQNFSLTNESVPQNINLFDLNISRSQKFLIIFKDTNLLPVDDALIDIQRKYVSDGLFRSVEIPKTDEFGQAVGHFDLDGVIYTIIISKEGTILATFDNIAVVCQDLLIEDCRLNLNIASAGEAYPEWEKLGGIEYTFNFNNNTRTITVVFSTTDGSSKTVLLNTTRFDRFGNLTVCTDTLTSSSGTLTCVIPESFGNVTVVSKLFSDGELITTRIFSILPDARAFFGDDAIIMVLILLMTIPLMLSSSNVGLIVGVLMGILMATALLIMQGGSLVGAGVAFIWAVIAGGIVIWKINQKKGT